MDFETLTTLLLIFLYILFQFAGKSKKTGKKPVPGAPTPTPSQPQPWDELQRALEEIRGRLQPAEPVEEPAPVSQTENGRLAEESLERRTATFDGEPLRATEQPTLSRKTLEEPSRPIFETPQRQLPLEGPTRTVRPQAVPSRIERPSAPTERPATQRIQSADITRRLLDPKNAREAFILSEVFGAPISRRRR